MRSVTTGAAESREQKHTRTELLKKIKSKAIKTRERDGPLYSGQGKGQFDWLFSFHDFFVDPEALDLFALLFWQHYRYCAPLQVGGLEISGIPLVIAILQKAQELGIEATGFFIRKERKTRAQARFIDGDLSGNPIVLVDDVFKSGRTAERARVAIESSGGRLNFVCAMVSFDWQQGAEWSRTESIEVTSFFELSDLDLSSQRPLHRPEDRRNQANIAYEPLWHFAAPDPTPTYMVPKSTPLLKDGRLYFGSDAGVFWALNANNGEVEWSFKTIPESGKGIWSSPAEHDGKVFFGAYNGNAYCLDKNSGDLIWESALCEFIGSSPVIVPKENSLVIGTEYAQDHFKGGIAAIDIDTGEKIWEHPLERLQHGSASYWEERNLLIAGSSDYDVLALDAATGDIVWKCPTERSIKYPPVLCVERNMVATASFDGKIRLCALDTGALLFEEETDDICYTSPLFHGRYLFCGSGDRHLYIIDLDELRLTKKILTKGRVYSSPNLVDGNVIFGNTAGVVEEINGTTLATENAVQLPDAVTNKIIVSDDQASLFILTYMNEIFALKRHRHSSAD